MIFLSALLAMVIELIVGYPAWLNRTIGHPVIWIGALIEWADNRWNRARYSPRRRRVHGLLGIMALVALSLAVGNAVLILVILIFGGGSAIAVMLPVAIISSSLLAQRALYAHVAAVAAALESGDGVSAGRAAVAKIVGRDPAALDEAGIARAAIESLAENFSDGVVAPAFWLALGGLPVGLAYKAINTADSMIGYKTERHRHFGEATARLDDLINLPASRLSALLLVAAAALGSPASARGAWRAVRADARAHRSPNAGWPEAAMAGALALSLAGPRLYDGALVDDTEMGRGNRREASAADIRAALRLYIIANALLMALLAIASALTIWMMTLI